MRYCIFSDVHGNWEAFEAVISALSKEKIDQFISLGDVIGYGADPHACIKALRLLGPSVLIAGNHEWGALGLLDMEYFNEYAAAAILWTKRHLDKEELGYLRSFRLLQETGKLTLVHGSLQQPARFNYIIDSAGAEETFRLLKTPLCFVAHTHEAGAYALDQGGIAYAGSPTTRIEKGKKYIINVGSIGQPRDGDPRAAFVIYDDREARVETKRVAYDVKAAQGKIIKAGLPAWLASRLTEGR